MTDIKVPEQDWWLYHYGVNNFQEAAAKFKVADDKADHEIRLSQNGNRLRITCTCGEWSFTAEPSEEGKVRSLEIWKEQHAALI